MAAVQCHQWVVRDVWLETRFRRAQIAIAWQISSMGVFWEPQLVT